MWSLFLLRLRECHQKFFYPIPDLLSLSVCCYFYILYSRKHSDYSCGDCKNHCACYNPADNSYLFFGKPHNIISFHQIRHPSKKQMFNQNLYTDTHKDNTAHNFGFISKKISESAADIYTGKGKSKGNKTDYGACKENCNIHCGK